MTRPRTKRMLALALFLVLAALLLVLMRTAVLRHQARPQQAKRVPSKATETEVEVVVEQVRPAAKTVAQPPDPPAEAAATEAAGAFPPIWCSYREQVGFRNYAAEMERRGAVFFLYSRARGGWFEIDRATSTLRPFDVGQVGRVFGGKPNCIEDEPALGGFAAGEPDGAVEVFLAKPLAMETRIQSAIRQALQARGIALAKVTGIKGVYDFVNGGFALVVTEIATRDQGAQGMGLTIPL